MFAEYMIYRILSIFLIPLMMGLSFSKVFVFAAFELNRSYIVANLCENRDKPMLHCNGKCYLAKRLKQAEQKEKAHDLEVQKSLSQDVYTPSSFVICFSTNIVQLINTPYTGTPCSGFPLGLIQPPKGIV